jgi:PHD/YefM family antitoxin component YafN of YafNO toxin-antitoxin module
MPRTLNLDQFEGGARTLLETALSDGEPVLLLRDGEPIAVLASPTALQSARLGDLPRWEEWLHEMKESISSATAGGRYAPSIPLPEQPQIDKTQLGFDLAAGVVGSDDGREFLRSELVRLGVPISDEKLLGQVYAQVLRLCEDKERVYEEDVRAVAQKEIAQAPQRLRLLSVTVSSATGLPATAEVTVELGHGPAMRREQGDGPLDAAFKAIQRLVSLEPEVENFSVVAATPGSDALAEAVIALSFEGRRFLGAGTSTNAIEAGIQAYVNALNFLLEERPVS